MTLNEIKQLFPVGSRVRAKREGGKPLTIHGNTGTTVLPANNTEEIRTVKAVKSMEWVFTRADGRDIHTTFPKASEVVEARAGFVQFRYNNGVVVTLELAPAPEPSADFVVENQGSIVLFRPLTEAGKEFLGRTAPDDAQFFGGAMVVEPRYVSGVVSAIESEGLSVIL